MKYSCSALLFDNDGVLVDSHAAAKVAWDIWAAKYHPGYDLDKAKNAGRRAEDMVAELTTPELFEEARELIDRLEQETAHMTVPLAGAKELLQSLPNGLWTICTSANPNLGKARLEAAGLPIPTNIVTGADVERGKPFPDAYLLGAKRVGKDPEDCVVFEDAQSGVLSAFEAGIGLVIGVGTRGMETEADLVVKDLTGISFDGEVLVIPDKNRLR
jgi:mannitol-1-/sugar-/sorbitol-6-phosphatase